VVVRLCMRINSVDTGPTSLTPERPRANERGSRPQELAERSARAVRIRAGDSPLATPAGSVAAAQPQ